MIYATKNAWQGLDITELLDVIPDEIIEKYT